MQFISLSYIENEDFCYNLKKLSRAVTRLYDYYLEPVGIRSTQFSLLLSILDSTKNTIKISKEMGMDRTTVSRNFKVLIKLGLTKQSISHDNRVREYSLTLMGRQIVEKAIPLWEKAQEEIINKWGNVKAYKLLKQLKELKKVDILFDVREKRKDSK